MNNLFPIDYFPEPARRPGQVHAIGLRCEPVERVRIAFVGLGMRMLSTLKRFIHIEGAEIRILCDITPTKIKKAVHLLESHGIRNVSVYEGEDDWRRVCERKDIDLVYISTHHDLHVPIAVYAMQCGKHTAIEVPAATSVDECWELVNTAELTRRHCMQLENCNYGEFEMATLNMVQQGLFGDLIHVEGAYIHDLKKLIFDTENGYWNMWRLNYLKQRNGNLYPTHGIGPLSHALNIHRGDKFDFLVSVSSDQFSLNQYARETMGDDGDYAKSTYRSGSMNSTTIRTNKGKTISLQYDITSPRPYSRNYLLSGTKGFAQKWPQPAMSFDPNGMCFVDQEELLELLKEYEHPIRKLYHTILEGVGADIQEIIKNDGMDYIMDARLVYCLQNGLPLDQDVYDAAEWSAITDLSEKSVENSSAPIRFPDFTRGAWNEMDSVLYHL